MGSFDVPLDDERTQLDTFVEEYRSALDVTFNGLTEDQAPAAGLSCPKPARQHQFVR